MSKVYEKNLVKQLGFSPKENTAGIYNKVYVNGFIIEIDFDNKAINYGKDIKCENKTSQNFSQPENFVVLECVNRLLDKGYSPKDIVLEKTFPAGRGHSGRLDIFVKKDEKAFLMIECKTYGKEFEKELKKIEKNGGQLFTYFQQDTETKLLMLYASKLTGNEITFGHRIIKIEEEYRQAGNVEKLYKIWDKSLCEQGFWENMPYDFKEELFTKSQLEPLTEDEGKKLFHGFATILRKHSVSDKPNAFNVIFNLFLAKLWDEHKDENDELEFQWKRKDDPVDFQVRLHNLHKDGLNDFLKKEVEGIYDTNFASNLTIEEIKAKKKSLLKFNKFFGIKDVFDDETFEQNHRVLMEVVKLIEKYRIRYPRKQEYLSEFFELLLTTGLKQEAGQYFTPVPITKYIVKSLPVQEMIEQEMNNTTAKLPAVIDYAAGSGHFITEIMEEYQNIIDNLDINKFTPDGKRKARSWSKDVDPYSWASTFIYGIEKDYRLVKVAKVGCYFYGDGLAQIVHGDGLDSLTNPPKSYIGLLGENNNLKDSSKAKFSIVVANPPYSVKYCKEDLEYIGSENEFTLYKSLTENSSEIECLFVERTKQLLKDGGVAGIILPSSILNNEGIYTKTREIILQYFEIIAITELGSNTFMATGTNTIVLFLRRRNNLDSIKLKEFVDNFFVDFIDNNPPKPFNTIDLEKPFTKYVHYVWQNVNLNDYISFLKNKPNDKIKEHDFYKAYRKLVDILISLEIEKAKKSRKNYSKEGLQKVKDNIEKRQLDRFREIEKEKILYFILSYNQTVTLVKTGNGNDEKHFLGYEFSNRKGHEGIRAIQGKDIDECTKLYNLNDSKDKTKASTFIYKAFSGDTETPIHESLKNNVTRARLIDMLTFDRQDFIKNISTSVKKKVKYDEIWKTDKLIFLNDNVVTIQKGTSITREKVTEGAIPVVAGGKEPAYFHNVANRKGNIITVSASGAYSGFVNYFEEPIFASDCNTIKSKDEEFIPTKLIYWFLKSIQEDVYKLQKGQAQPHVYADDLKKIKIPLPSKEIQKKIVAELETLEEREEEVKVKIGKEHEKIENLFTETYSKSINTFRLSDDIFIVSIGKRVVAAELNNEGTIPVYSANVFEPFGYIDRYLIEDFSSPSVLWGIDGDWMVNYIPAEKPFYPTDHCGVLRIKTNDVLPKYLAWVLKKEGIEQRFSRTLRASIDRIMGLSIKAPPLAEQKKSVAEIEKIETKIQNMQRELELLSNEKEKVLKKYL